VVNRDAIANPECLDWSVEFAARAVKPAH